MKRLVISIIATLAIISIANAANPPQKKVTVVKAPTSTKVTTNKPVTPAKATVKKPVATTKKTVVKKDSVVAPTEKHYCIHITKADFLSKIADIDTNPNEWKYLGDKPCIIDFYTTWCGPCRVIAPVLEEIAKEYEGRIYIYKADAEKEILLAQAFKVQAYPTLVFCPMKGGPQMAKGALPKAQLIEIIDRVLLEKTAPPPPALLQRR